MSNRLKVIHEWLQSLYSARPKKPSANSLKKLKAVREAVKHHFPSADNQKILSEIEAGYPETKSY